MTLTEGLPDTKITSGFVKWIWVSENGLYCILSIYASFNRDNYDTPWDLGMPMVTLLTNLEGKLHRSVVHFRDP